MSDPDNASDGQNKPDAARGRSNDNPSSPGGSGIRGRGPQDCLNWEESDEEEFVPFTQIPEPPEPKLVFAKKSVAK